MNPVEFRGQTIKTFRTPNRVVLRFVEKDKAFAQSAMVENLEKICREVDVTLRNWKFSGAVSKIAVTRSQKRTRGDGSSYGEFHLDVYVEPSKKRKRVFVTSDY